MFIHQQIQSFLNLGVCKEYPIMAKPRFPKKTNDVRDTLPTSNPLPLSEATAGPTNGGATVAAVAARTPASTPDPKLESKLEATPELRTEARKAVRRPEIVRTEPRANLVPINVDDEIRRLAYLLAERRGFESGHETEDWLNAEREIRQRYRQQSA
jgi:hypothetical protein